MSVQRSGMSDRYLPETNASIDTNHQRLIPRIWLKDISVRKLKRRVALSIDLKESKRNDHSPRESFSSTFGGRSISLRVKGIVSTTKTTEKKQETKIFSLRQGHRRKSRLTIESMNKSFLSQRTSALLLNMNVLRKRFNRFYKRKKYRVTNKTHLLRLHIHENK